MEIPQGTPFFYIGKILEEVSCVDFYFYGYGKFPVDIRTDSIFRKVALDAHRRITAMGIAEHSELIEGERTSGKMKLAHIECLLEALDKGENKQPLYGLTVLSWHAHIWPFGGKVRDDMAFSTTGHIYADPINLYAQLDKLLQVEENPDDKWFYIAKHHYEIAHLHPFADGNGRIARLITNWLCAYYNLQPIRVCCEWRNEYISALEHQDFGRLKNLFIKSQVNWFH